MELLEEYVACLIGISRRSSLKVWAGEVGGAGVSIKKVEGKVERSEVGKKREVQNLDEQ